MLTRVLSRMFFGKDAVAYPIPDEDTQGQDDPLHLRLLDLLSEQKFNEAENLLFESVESGNLRHLAIALDFYARLSALSDSVLTSHSFSREETYQGLQDIARRFGVDTNSKY
ncbi:MAG TPA: DUF6483 family protein [Clostridia bacterium]|nr:DUF6483 family protein [Clostridia bacterium]